MATLDSPGVSVTVTDESFYTPSAPGTVPLIIVASAENKKNAAGTGTAAGTLKANAGKVYLLTSQKELIDTFGTPVFKTDASNNPIHAGEQNEYGLQTAYSYLGTSNRAYVVRADLDLGQLDRSADAPTGKPANGTLWFDTANSQFGVFEWNSAPVTTTGGQTFKVKYPTVITDSANLTSGAPKATFGVVGDYAVVSTTTLHTLWYKKGTSDTPAGTWVRVGDDDWKRSWPCAQGTAPTGTSATADSMVINTVSISGFDGQTGTTLLENVASAINSNPALDPEVKAAVVNGRLEIYSSVDVTIAAPVTPGNTGALTAKVGLSATTYKATALQISPHTSIPLFKTTDNAGSANGMPTGSIWVKSTNPNLGADWIVKKYNLSSVAWQTVPARLYSNAASALNGLDPLGGGINLATGALYVKYNDSGATPNQLAEFKIYARSASGPTVIKSVAVTTNTLDTTNYEFDVSYTQAGSSTYSSAVTVGFIGQGTAIDATNFVSAFNAVLAGSPVSATVDAETNQIVITHNKGGDILFTNTEVDDVLAALFTDAGYGAGDFISSTANWSANTNGLAGNYVASLWTATVGGVGIAEASATAPANIPESGRLWYNSNLNEVDILVHNGETWVGYKYAGGGIADASPFYTATPSLQTDPAGPIVSATRPTTQSDGTPLSEGDLWIDSSDTENYPRISKFNYQTKKWVLVNNTDQTTENGIVFADARWSNSGDDEEPASIQALLTSEFLDFDAPDPALYPRGTLLWNLRRSGNNVKRFVQDYIDVNARNRRYGAGEGEQMTSYYPHRWVTASANNDDGSGAFGRKSQRKVVTQALQALVRTNQQIRDEESRIFNLIACPGYAELIKSMVELNYERGITAFVIGDTPARLASDATTLSNWGTNRAAATNDGDQGLVTSDEYLGVFYPWGYTVDNTGRNIVVPPSHMMLRTVALSDQVSYPWFAPAGTRRGGVTNATAVGYVDSTTGEFQSVALNNGQRDTLQAETVKINPITFITGTGLVNYGQKTRAKNASALDRINVARLVIYLRRQLSQLAKPYVFEPNDKITRDEIKNATESLLLELVGQRALYDYVVVCDTSNNTPFTIDRSELYLDVAIEPVKAVEFIYIPLRLKNTGEIQASSNR
jgi:hypothetical protein